MNSGKGILIDTSILDQAKRKYKKAKVAYYNKDKSIMTDAEFDKLEKSIRRLDPEWSELKKTGVKVTNKKIEVPLLEFMPSLDKEYPEDMPKMLKRSWVRNVTSWIQMHKLDGTSLQLMYTGKRKRLKPTRLITRGNGELGGDISFFIPWLLKHKMIPAILKADSTKVVLRLEGVMSEKTFKAKWTKVKSGDGWDNARNGVNGVFNRMDEHPALKDIDLVVLGVYGYTIGSGLYHAKHWGFKVVENRSLRPTDVTAEKFIKDLEIAGKTSIYKVDGLVFGPVGFRMVYATNDKPKQLRAFKVNDESDAVEVVAEEEIWRKTRLNRWSCKIRINPTEMDGVMVKYVTAHNPGWMKEKGVGKGAILRVLRSGGVIPKIVGVVKKAKFQGPPGKYELRGRFFYAAEEDSASDVQKIHHFMTTLGIEFLAEKTIEKLYTADLKSPQDYISLVNYAENVAVAKLVKRGGLGNVMAQKIYKELTRVLKSRISMKKLMVASGCFAAGVGERRLSAIENAGISMDKLLGPKYDPSKSSCNKLYEISGFAEKTVNLILRGTKEFKIWFEIVREKLEVDGTLPKVKKVKEGKLTQVVVSWTGYRSKEQEEFVVEHGGEIGSFSSKTKVLLYKEGGKASSKVAKAGNKAMTWPEFIVKYSGVKS